MNIIYRRATLKDAQELNDKMLKGWPSAWFGSCAWFIWHADSCLNTNNRDIPVVAVEVSPDGQETIIGSILGRIRPSSFGLVPVGEWKASEEELEQLGWKDLSEEDKSNATKLMNHFERSYEGVTTAARLELGEGRDYIHIRQMTINENLRGKGIGGTLLEMMLTEARARGLAVQLESWGRGKEFYKKHGAKQGPLVWPINLDGLPGDEHSLMTWYC